MSTAATHTYAAEPRIATGTKAATKLRKAGKVPLTLTKRGQPSQLFTMDAKAATELHRNVIHLCKLEVGGKTITALRAEIATNCLSDQVEHIDLIEVDEQSEIKVDVSVVPDARDCPGVKAGGIVELRARKIKVLCKAGAIPDSLTLSLNEVQITETVFADQVQLPAGVKLAVPAKTPVLTVVIPRQMLKAEEMVVAKPVEGAEAAAGAAGAEAKPGDAKPGDAKAGDAKPGDAKAGDAKAGDAKAGDAKKK
jgi:large subunit ribosomal protein L25